MNGAECTDAVRLAPAPADESRPFSVCYVVPGHNLLPSAGPTRNVLSLARALARRTDVRSVAVAFRRVLEPPPEEGYQVLEIAPTGAAAGTWSDDSAVRGVGYREFGSYLRDLARFARSRLPAFDVVLEKSWLLSGFVTARCRRLGIPGVPVENLVPVVDPRWQDPMKAIRNRVARTLAGRYLRRAPVLLAETEELKDAIVRTWRVPAERIQVVPLGVDRSLFRPRDPGEARRRLEIDADATVLLYVGVLDLAHDLGPAIRAVVAAATPGLELHVVGDGIMREAFEALAAGAPATIRFHGRVPHPRVPHYVAAADLCLAPYEPRAFPGGEVGYATLKVREYLSAARPVAAVESGSLSRLVRHGESGFLLPNRESAWRELLERLPSRNRLRQMGEAAARTPLTDWDDAAAGYAAACRRLLALAPGTERRSG